MAQESHRSERGNVVSVVFEPDTIVGHDSPVKRETIHGCRNVFGFLGRSLNALPGASCLGPTVAPFRGGWCLLSNHSVIDCGTTFRGVNTDWCLGPLRQFHVLPGTVVVSGTTGAVPSLECRR